MPLRLLVGTAVCLATAATAFAQTQPRASAAVSEKLVLVPSPVAGVMMRTRVYRPAGAGRYPLVVISHGTSSNRKLRAFQKLSIYRDLALWFRRRGFVAAVPQRPGHGATGGKWLEDYGRCEDPHYARAGFAIAASISKTIDYMIKQPYVRKRPVLLVGHSAGAWGTLAFASQNPRTAAAVINFAGGLGGRSYNWPNRNCAPDRLIRTVRRFGRTTRIPTLWLYARNDSYFGPDLSRAMSEAYRKAGGRVEYHLLPAAGDDGHFLLFDRSAAASWQPLLAAFLRRHHLAEFKARRKKPH